VKLIFVCFYEAYPPVSGAASVTWNVAKHSWGKRVLIQLGHHHSQEHVLDGVRVLTLKGASDSKWKKISGLRRRIQEIAGNIDRIAPDVVILEGASWALYHWLLLRQVRRRLPQAKVVYHSHNVEYLLRQEKHGRMVVWITKWAEGNILRNVDLSFAVSEVDAQHFKELYDIRPLLLPNAVDVEKFNNVTEDDVRELRAKYGLNGTTVLFMGLPSYKPNKEGLDFLIHHVFPDVVKKCPDARLAIIGGELSCERPWIINPGIIPYEEVPIFIKACDAGVAPIFSGSGTRLKILEHMAGRKPVISTSKGAEGLGVTAGKNIVLADDAKGFAEGIVSVLEEPKLSKRLGSEGSRLVKTTYSWRTTMQEFSRTVCTAPPLVEVVEN
jgi:glycosyltransferase involved in cell wall biosynthesis